MLGDNVVAELVHELGQRESELRGEPLEAGRVFSGHEVGKSRRQDPELKSTLLHAQKLCNLLCSSMPVSVTVAAE